MIKSISQDHLDKIFSKVYEWLKTVIGRTETGFYFLGYHFSQKGLGIAKKTFEKFLSRAIRLYEQESGKGFASPPAWIIHTEMVCLVNFRNPLMIQFTNELQKKMIYICNL